jgi:hypothetical protein
MAAFRAILIMLSISFLAFAGNTALAQQAFSHVDGQGNPDPGKTVIDSKGNSVTTYLDQWTSTKETDPSYQPPGTKEIIKDTNGRIRQIIKRDAAGTIRFAYTVDYKYQETITEAFDAKGKLIEKTKLDGDPTKPDEGKTKWVWNLRAHRWDLVPADAAYSQPPLTLPVAVHGDADTGKGVSVVFQSGYLQAGPDKKHPEVLRISFKIKVTIDRPNYTNGATEYFSTKFLSLHMPRGKVMGPSGPGLLYPEHCGNDKAGPKSCTIWYSIPRGEPGVYTIMNDYKGCCGTRHGRITFTVPRWKTASLRGPDEARTPDGILGKLRD